MILSSFPMHLFHLQRSTIVILGIFAALLWYPVYIGVLQFVGYHVVTSTVDPENAKQAALKEALEKKDVEICKNIVVPFFYMGPAEYDLVNGCYMGYIHETNDISLCREVISSASCVTAIAVRTNNPELCVKAYFPEFTMYEENRGTCFGYFAGKERDYGYCSRLENLEGMNEHQKIICYVDYIEATKDHTICPKLEAIDYKYNSKIGNQELQSKQYSVDQCYKFAARIAKDSSICSNIFDQQVRAECYEQFN